MDQAQILELAKQARTAIEAMVASGALKKAEPGQDDDDKNPVGGGDEKESSASPPAPKEASAPAAESSPSEPPHEGSAGPDPSPEGSAADQSMAADPAQDLPVDPQHLQAEYAALPLDALKMHVSAAQAALAILVGGAQSPAASAPAPMPQSAPAAAPASAPAMSPASGGAPDMAVALKSELASQFDTLKKSLSSTLAEEIKRVQAQSAEAVAAAEKKSAEAVAKLRESEEALRKAMASPSLRRTLDSVPQEFSVTSSMSPKQAAKAVLENFRKSNGNAPIWNKAENAALAVEALQKGVIEYERVKHLVKE